MKYFFFANGPNEDVPDGYGPDLGSCVSCVAGFCDLSGSCSNDYCTSG